METVMKVCIDKISLMALAAFFLLVEMNLTENLETGNFTARAPLSGYQSIDTMENGTRGCKVV
jgi:hypothetical protein